MYKDNQTKSTSSLGEIRKTFSKDEIEQCPSKAYPTDNIKRQGDIEQQIHTLTNNTIEIEKILNELLIKIEPILSLSLTCNEEKDCCKEEQLSPLATDIRAVNYRLNNVKMKIVDAYKRVQL
jgi:hypothetical protein